MEDMVISLKDVFHFQQLGIDADGKAVGQFQTTGVRPKCMARMVACGIELPSNLFVQRILLRV